MYLGDASMFTVSSNLREEVWAWSEDMGILIEYNGTDFGLDVWRVVESRHYDWFVMRWL